MPEIHISHSVLYYISHISHTTLYTASHISQPNRTARIKALQKQGGTQTEIDTVENSSGSVECYECPVNTIIIRSIIGVVMVFLDGLRL